ncbi:MAG: tRNA-modifying protein YgfZ [Buchnera aphidicola (Nurudea yanoniella)]
MKRTQLIKKYLPHFFKKEIILMNLNKWVLTTITGCDSKKYLQNQITINVNKLNKNHKICAHCNINGKVWSSLRIFKVNENTYMYLQRRSIADYQIKKMKKYSIFSKVTIFKNSDMFIIGVTGKKAQIELSKYFGNFSEKNSSVYHKNNAILLKFNSPCTRFLLISKKENIIVKKILKLSQEINNNLWLTLDIASQFPIIEKITSGKFLPQSLNLENLNGLDLKKGCYHGQEMISKIHFKNLNKYILFWISQKSNKMIKIGEIIESKDENKQWNNVGYVLAASQVNHKTIWIQAIIKKNIKINSKIRIKNDFNENIKIIA